MRDLNIVDVEMMNNEMHLDDESEVIVTLDSGGMSGSSSPPLASSSEVSSKKQSSDDQSSNGSCDELNRVSKFPPPPLIHIPSAICNSENMKGEKEKKYVIPCVINTKVSLKYPTAPDSLVLENTTHCNIKNNSSKQIICDEQRRREKDQTLFPPSFKPNIPNIDDFKILKVLGKGAYGKVYQVRKIKGPGAGQIYAMKAMNKSRICGSKTDVRHTKAERDVLVSVHKEQNPFIVRLHFAFETERRLYLVQEFCCGGELFRRMEFERLMLERDAKFYLSEIVVALEYLHSKGIVYRDLKTENVMLDRKGHVKLIDFGLSKMNMWDETVTNTFCGTVEYMAPEVILRSSGYGKPADWWSLGIFTFDLLTGRSPFHSNQGKAATKERILKGKFPTPKILTPEAGDFIRRLLRKSVLKRLGTQGAWEVKSHGIFGDLDWDMVVNKQYKPPFEPFVLDETDVQHFDQQFTSRSPRESNDVPPNHKDGEKTNKSVVDNVANMFDDFDYVAEEFIQPQLAVATEEETQTPRNHENNVDGGEVGEQHKVVSSSDDIDTNPVDDVDVDVRRKSKQCLKCLNAQLYMRNNRSDNTTGDPTEETTTVEDLKELRICSHGS